MDSDGKKPKSQPNSLLHRERDSRNWTLQDVADKLYDMCVKEERESRISADTVGRWERGVSKPEAHYRAKLCDLFGKNARQLGFTDEALSDEVPSADDPQEETFQVAGIPHEYPSMQPTTSIDLHEHQPIQLYLPNGLPHVVTVQIYQQNEKIGAAIKAAQESNHHTLQATGWGWASLAWTYEGNVHKALDCIQTARQLAMLSDSIIVRTWLAAIDAEAQAKLQSADACRKALDDAARVEEAEQAELDHYWTSYDKVQFEGYEGSCYRLLYQYDDVRTHAYISDAQRALKEALAETDPVMVRLQSVFLSDLAGTYIQQREIEQACRLAQQALLANAPQSQMIVQRVLALRQDLEQWKNLQEVKNLDAHLMPLLIRSKLN